MNRAERAALWRQVPTLVPGVLHLEPRRSRSLPTPQSGIVYAMNVPANIRSRELPGVHAHVIALDRSGLARTATKHIPPIANARPHTAPPPPRCWLAGVVITAKVRTSTRPDSSCSASLCEPSGKRILHEGSHDFPAAGGVRLWSGQVLRAGHFTRRCPTSLDSPPAQAVDRGRGKPLAVPAYVSENSYRSPRPSGRKRLVARGLKGLGSIWMVLRELSSAFRTNRIL